MSLDQQFNTLNDKVQRLLKNMDRLQKENERLRAEVASAKKNEAAAYSSVDELKQQIAILKYANGEMNERDKKDFERKITQYIREIDKCIAYLSQ